MYLGGAEILRRAREFSLIEGFTQEGVQGSGVDLRIDKLFELDGGARLSRNERVLPAARELPGESFVLQPRSYYLCLTAEKVNMPDDLVAFILPRSTLFRGGVSLKSAVVDPGYKGALTMGLMNETDREFHLERGARIAQIVFSYVSGDATSYRGKYQGGRVV
ncbi:MAG: dCTP deaminase [Candidatus Hydrothermarchaeaceae archaeon]